jgi:hypothetical protein
MVNEILKELFDDQEFILNYLEARYVITPYNHDFRIRERSSGEVIYGKDLLEEITDLFSFGEELTNRVFKAWYKHYGLTKDDNVSWYVPWERFNITMNGWIDYDSPSFVREMTSRIAQEIDNSIANTLLPLAMNYRDIEGICKLIGYNIYRTVDHMGLTYSLIRLPEEEIKHERENSRVWQGYIQSRRQDSEAQKSVGLEKNGHDINQR